MGLGQIHICHKCSAFVSGQKALQGLGAYELVSSATKRLLFIGKDQEFYHHTDNGFQSKALVLQAHFMS